MLKHKDHFHGSDLEKIEEIYGIKKEDITSFSANVNPLGISPKMREALIRHINIITSYPDREYTALRTRIGEYAGASAQISLWATAPRSSSLFSSRWSTRKRP